jgi:glycolate oxidase iron-sulfur subunit
MNTLPFEKTEFLEEISKCVRCGGCKAYCPTYEEGLSEPLGARGRLMLLKGLVEGSLQPSRLLNERIFSCILCGACSGTCPLGIDVREAVFRGRALLSKTDGKRSYLRTLVRFATRWPDLAFRSFRLGRHLVLPPLVRKGILPVAPELPDTPLKKAGQVFTVPQKKGRVAVFAGCSTNFLFPHLGESLINVLQHLGYEVILPKSEVCCGAPLRSLGLEKEAAALARKNFQLFSRLNVDAVLSLCPTCVLALKTEYPGMIGKSLDNVMDISVFLRDKIASVERIDKTAFYHDPCHLLYGLGVGEEPRETVKKAGLDLIEGEGSGCCGFGGLYCLSYRQPSLNILNTCASRITSCSPDTVITSCPGCILQLSRIITDRPVLHLIELVEEAYCFRKSDHSTDDCENEPALIR